jgi:hypothetical protein
MKLNLYSTTSGNATTHLIGVPICPDLLRHELLGEADCARGHVVRAFFWLMRFWPVP